MIIDSAPNNQTLRVCLVFALVTLMTMLPLSSLAQSDSTRNTLSFGINFLAHGEACGGGLPKATAK